MQALSDASRVQKIFKSFSAQSLLIIATTLQNSLAFAQSRSHSLPPQPTQTVNVQWDAPAPLAGEIASSLRLSSDNIKSLPDAKSGTTKGLPIVALIVGAALFTDLSRTLLDIWKNSWPGVIIQRDSSGNFKVTTVKGLPPGCVIYDYGTTKSQCIFNPSNLGEDPSPILASIINKKI
jgi:hypothetical protein